MTRLAFVQLVLFAITAAVVVPYGIYYVVGPAGLTGQLRVHSIMTNAMGLTPGTSVTYRGIPVGTVDSVALDPAGGGARVEYVLDGGVPIPADSVAKATMGTVAGIQNVDIYPNTAEGPYLEDGDLLPAPEDQQPVQMDGLMLEASTLLQGIDPQSVSDLGTEMGASFEGLGPSLAAMIDDGDSLSVQLRDQAPALQSLLARTARLVDTMAGESDSFVDGMAAARDLATQLDANAPVLVYLTDQSPQSLANAQQLFDRYQGTFGSVLANLATVEPIIAERSDALASGLVDIPAGLARLESIVTGDRADFALIATQGPVCNYPTERRAVGDLSPTSPNLNLYCPPARDLATRGAQNAPRPNDLGLQGSTTPGSVIGPPVVEDPILIPTGVDALNYWRSLLEGLGSATR
ncbi:MCE family protein [Rhodococcus triatomae]|uniref:Phospholipid/cholesterol/gamma-HCH transport system substrate-binding protein n=1 Tax=Rhodococcus triatomae TaxID=300028 RepID=A0A1G8REN0_9NOCA|nr:MlaD family protein [Rhodococcus triatomae]QNG19643.1 MCE family protein [Rhodococcus triatomae]QNG24442.1 MCE family protein [Rhodococcus triatomae]SDJ14810.1 phospholipid/cholesterol/gamma-HCH transport system substrate-binding protein [Rhodococcus triatomae]